MTKEARFWNWIAKRYSKQAVANEDAYQYKLKKTQELLTEDSNVLEIGCGTGTTALYHAPKLKHILAVDISHKMIAIAEEKKQKAGLSNLEFKCSPISELHLKDESYDMVMAHSILHLVEDRDAVLAKLNKALKKDAFLVSSTACVKEILPIFGIIAPIAYKLNLLPLVKVFAKDELIKSMEATGFKIIHTWQPSNKEAVFIIAQKI